MLKKLLLITLLISTPAVIFSMCNQCTLTPDTDNPYEIPIEEGTTEVRNLAFSPRCNLLALATTESLIIYPVDSENCSLGSPTTFDVNFYRSVAFSPNGNCLAVGRGSVNATITTFSIDDNCSIIQVSDLPDFFASDLKFSPDSHCLAALESLFNVVQLFTVNPDCSLTLIFTSDTFGFATDDSSRLAFSPNGNCLVITFPTGIAVYPVERDALGNCIGLGDATVITDNVSNPVSIDFSSNGNCLAVGNGDGTGVSIFTVNPATCELVYSTQLLEGELIGSVKFSPFGSCLAVHDRSNIEVNMFNVTPSCTFTSNQMVPIPNIISSTVSDFSANGHCFAIASQLPTFDNRQLLYMFSTNIVVPPVITQAVSQCGGTVLVTGTATPNFTVQVFVDGNLAGSTIASETGTFEVTVGSFLPGAYTITATATNNIGCSSGLSSPFIVVFDVILPIINGVTTTCVTVGLSGTTSANTPVTLFIDGIPVGSVVSNASGNFVFVNLPVSGGFHSFVAQVIQEGCILNSAPFNTIISFPNNCNPLISPNLSFGGHCNV